MDSKAVIEDMIEKEKLEEFVRRSRDAAGTNLESVILFGSSVSGDFHPGLSNLNLLCVLQDASFAALRSLAPLATWWEKQKQPPPLCMTRLELERSTDVFTIELLDMQRHHRILFGADVVQGLRIPMDLHRVQVEYELREKLILLRQHLLVASADDARLWNLLLRSAPSFATLFRHALIALGDSSRSGRPEAVQALAQKIGFDASAILQVLDMREQKSQRKKIGVEDLFDRYLKSIEKVIDAVDRAMSLDAPNQG